MRAIVIVIVVLTIALGLTIGTRSQLAIAVEQKKGLEQRVNELEQNVSNLEKLIVEFAQQLALVGGKLYTIETKLKSQQ